MKKFLICLALFVSTTVMAQSFLPATDDIPLMKGLYSVEETATFDSPSEKMVLISAQTDKTQNQVKDFYRQTLMNLGWSQSHDNYYIRGNDTLTMELSQVGRITTIQFTLVQKN